MTVILTEAEAEEWQAICERHRDALTGAYEAPLDSLGSGAWAEEDAAWNAMEEFRARKIPSYRPRFKRTT